ncbi:universal stress protein UspA [Paraburkholderia steynii]|uniref:Universal stress protein UspA n=1 Tax=Paraburkholderia steynii TaxID=1245441 RepID=A0A4R0XB67_9BURK|nr:universal stress protein UspA [Paraburkholderia steynii]
MAARRSPRHGGFMYTRILVAVDGSNTSRRAFDGALNLASKLGATLRAFYAVENTPMYFDAPGYDPSILRNRLVEQGKELTVELSARCARRGYRAISRWARRRRSTTCQRSCCAPRPDFNADLIIMGTHGRRGMQRLILGSVAERCVRQSTLPVLLIPSAASGGEAEEEAKA